MTLFENELAKGLMSIIYNHFSEIKIKEEDAIFYAKELAPQILPYTQEAEEQNFYNERKVFDKNKIEGQISYLANERDGSKELRAKLPINLTEFDFGEKVDIIILKK